MRIARVFLFALAELSPSILLAVPADVSFTKPAAQVARFDFVEITLIVPTPDATNPFEDASLSGSLETADGSHVGPSMASATPPTAPFFASASWPR